MPNPSGPHISYIDITYQALIRVVVVGLVVFLLFHLRQIIAAVLFAVVVASAIEPGVKWFQKYRIPRIAGVLLIYLIGFAILAGTIYLIVPVVVGEFRALLDSFPQYQRVLLQELRAFQNLPFYSYFSENAEDVILNPPFSVGAVGGGVLDVIFSIFGGIISGVILIVVSFYLASQEKGIEHFLRMIAPLQSEEYIIDLWTRSQAKIGRWLRGQLLLGLIVGVMVYIALTALGIRYALILALLAMVFELIPIIGPILAAAPAVFFAFVNDPLLGIIVAVVYVIIQQLESHLLVPVVMQRAVGLNPLIVIIALLVGANLGGILGMFLAVPGAAILVEFLTDIDLKKRGLFHYGGGA